MCLRRQRKHKETFYLPLKCKIHFYTATHFLQFHYTATTFPCLKHFIKKTTMHNKRLPYKVTCRCSMRCAHASSPTAFADQHINEANRDNFILRNHCTKTPLILSLSPKIHKERKYHSPVQIGRISLNMELAPIGPQSSEYSIITIKYRQYFTPTNEFLF